MRQRIKEIRARFAKWRERQREKLEQLIHRRRRDTEKRIDKVKDRHDQGEPFPMFDSIDIDQIPADAKAVAGYVNGLWPTFALLKKHWPDARRLSIAVTSNADAECLDIEPGNAEPADGPAWVKRQLERGVHKPVIYCAVSAAEEVLRRLRSAGIDRDEIRLWTAHYTLKPHICDQACGFGMSTRADATQWTDHSGNHNLDESLCRAGFLDNPDR